MRMLKLAEPCLTYKVGVLRVTHGTTMEPSCLYLLKACRTLLETVKPNLCE